MLVSKTRDIGRQGMMLGNAMWNITGGTGAFAGARGSAVATGIGQPYVADDPLELFVAGQVWF
jgi:hypothetical protein